MRYNIIVWDLTKPKRPELLADTWANKEITEAIDILKTFIMTDPMSRGIIIDWKTNKVVAELKFKEIKEYKECNNCDIAPHNLSQPCIG